MAKKLSDFLKNLIAKAGGNIEDEKLKPVLAAINADAEIDDEIATAIDHGLISLASAKNNHPDIKGHYFAAAYNGLDKELETIMADEKLADDIIAEIKKEGSSTKRAGVLVKKIKELESAKQNAGKGKTDELNTQIAELNRQLRTEKDSINGIKTEYEKKLRDKDKAYEMRNLLGRYKTIHDKLDPETKNIIINAIIDKNLKIKGYSLDTDENGVLRLTTKEGNNAFGDDNQPLTPNGFIDKMMAEENLLEVSGNQNNGNNNQPPNGQQRQYNTGQQQQRQQQQNQNGNNGNNNQKPNSVLKELVQRSQNDIKNTNGLNII